MENAFNSRVFTLHSVSDLDADHTFDCGQCFRWNREEDGSYTGVVKDRAVNIKAENEMLTIDNCSESDYKEIWAEYLDMDRDYAGIKKTLSQHDSVMEKAVKYGSGIRLLHQDPWETVISFIISQNSNIPRIKKCIESLCANFGESLGEYRGQERFAFPSAEKLASLSLEDFAVCRLGYRDKYILETARAVASDGGKTLAAARDMTFEDAEKYIRSLHGVGPKVANCILLFGLLKYESFPLDVWMKRIMHQLYGFEENDMKGMAAYAREHFGEYSGFAQQYLFYYARENL